MFSKQHAALCAVLLTLSGFGASLSTAVPSRPSTSSSKAQSVSRKTPPAPTSHHPSSPPANTVKVDFDAQIHPLLKAQCGACHSNANASSGFSVETMEALLKGGNKRGAAVTPGRGTKSVLVQVLKGQITPRMPMGGVMKPADIQLIQKWIDAGAPVKGKKTVVAAGSEESIPKGWPFAPPADPPIPHVKAASWVKNPVDAFILSRLETKGLRPAPPADRITLIRRATYDLLGLPPTPAEVDAFVHDASPKAYEKLVDRLLDDPRYGERWGRFWLDLVRYADSDGFENDGTRENAWRYRDYVIRSFNADKPYNRFVQEQIAGDELWPDDKDAQIATGFARLGPYDTLEKDPKKQEQDFLNDATDTTGSVFLGLTVGCAKCHNHKYDPIKQSDYYSLQAFFKPIRMTDTPVVSAEEADKLRATQQQHEEKAKGVDHQIEMLREGIRTRLKDQKRAALPAEVQAAFKVAEDQRTAEQKSLVEKNRDAVKVEDDEIDAAMAGDEKARNEVLKHQREDLDQHRPPDVPSAMTVTDSRDSVPATFLLKRGDLLTLGEEVYPQGLSAISLPLPPVQPPAKTNTIGRRAALAEWLTDPKNPLPARVLVNRVWQYHFGRGIVGTPSDFGRNGDPPTHPELLDWLAVRFVAEGWSLKKLHRLLMTSDAYQMSTQYNAAYAKADPLNHTFWRMNRQRLTGEAIRDGILAVAGDLNAKSGGPGIFPKIQDEVVQTGSTNKWGNSEPGEWTRRSVYIFQRRSLAHPLVEVFDGPDTSSTCPRRSQTTIAPQALALFNSEFALTEANRFADRVAKDAGSDPAHQVKAAYRLAFSRLPTAKESAQVLEFLAAQTAEYRKTPPAGAETPEIAALQDFCHVLLNSNEFVYLN